MVLLDAFFKRRILMVLIQVDSILTFKMVVKFRIGVESSAPYPRSPEVFIWVLSHKLAFPNPFSYYLQNGVSV